jgi:hypothetical protein
VLVSTGEENCAILEIRVRGIAGFVRTNAEMRVGAHERERGGGEGGDRSLRSRLVVALGVVRKCGEELNFACEGLG